MKEIWKPVVGFEGKYIVSNQGNVKSLSKGFILSTELSIHGYPRCRLRKNGKVKHYVIHRLVAKAFIPNPDNLPCIDHRDTDKTNNNIDNLHWVTYSQNSKNHLTVEKGNKFKYKPVMCVETGEIFSSAQELCRMKNFSYQGCTRGIRRGIYKGLHYKYIQTIK